MDSQRSLWAGRAFLWVSCLALIPAGLFAGLALRIMAWDALGLWIGSDVAVAASTNAGLYASRALVAAFALLVAIVGFVAADEPEWTSWPRTRLWIRRAAMFIGVGALALYAGRWAYVMIGRFPVPADYPDRGFFKQSLRDGLVPLLAAVAVGAAAVTPRRLWRACLIGLAVVVTALLGHAIIDESVTSVALSSIGATAYMLAPVAVYVIVSRRPLWWLAAALSLVAVGVTMWWQAMY